MKKVFTYLSIITLFLSSGGFDINYASAHCHRNHIQSALDDYCREQEENELKALLIVGGILIGGLVIYAIISEHDSTSYFVDKGKENINGIFEPYTIFDFDTEDFEAGLRYKHKF